VVSSSNGVRQNCLFTAPGKVKANGARQNWLFAAPGKVKAKKPKKKEQPKTQATTIMTFFNKPPVTAKPPNMSENKELEPRY
jgi:hypothetical protein